VTPFGKMPLGRRMYQNAKDTKTHFPLDAAWNMAGESMTLEVREALAYACALTTPEEAHALLAKCAGFRPHPTQIKRCVERIGDKVDAHRAGLEAAVRAPERAPDGTRAVVASLDGANVLLNEAGPKRGRPNERPKGSGRTVSPTCYKNAMVGAVSFYGAVPEGQEAPERLASRYLAHMPEDGAATFKGRFEAEVDAAQAQAPDAVRVVLGDGARGIWTYIERTPLYDGYERLVDYWHTVEHLSRAAEALFGKGTYDAARWFRRYKGKLLEETDGARRVLTSMAYYARTRRLSKSDRAALAQERTFFRRNRDKMHYAEFRRRGLPIGSGPVEAACKSIVNARLCRSGMRWSRPGGQRILDLRAHVKSGRWESFWQNLNQLPKAA